MVDIATPATFERFTGNWQASYEGFLPTPKSVIASIPKTLPGLENFYMAGQWVQAGGGLPSGVITGRQVVMQMCKKDGIPFGVQPDLEERKVQERPNHNARQMQPMSHPDR
jgi:phytoene dehydrogenase-like protein